jgi:ubiquinol-cytochrome c reductase cytochrome b subunit
MTDAETEETGGSVVRFVRWLDSRLGLSYPLMRPVPQYSINPFYWIGALTAVAFIIQAVTGTILLIWYVPNPSVAYQSTTYVFNSVNYGRFLETVHLYGAYAMILLAFMHLMRNYFVSSHKKPRELMWVFGMAMGFITLGFGFTGYLLPWTVVSVDATNVGLGLLGPPLPAALGNFAQSVLGISGGGATELVRFYDIHIVVLPAILLLLLFGKMYMFEAHGAGAPERALSESEKRTIPFFPDATLYLLELGALFSAALLIISAVFPYTLPAQYSIAASQAATPQPDWYFLWTYQILKISAFEGAGLPVALTVVTLIFVALFVLPFIDRGGERGLANRPKFVILGAIFVAELAVLSYWGEVTPGQIISNEQAALVLGGTAVIVAVVFVGVYRVLFSRLRGKIPSSAQTASSMRRAQIWTAAAFTLLLVGGSLAISGSVTEAAQMATIGITMAGLINLVAYLAAVGVVVLGTIYLLYRLDLANGSIKTKVHVFEVGWPNEE